MVQTAVGQTGVPARAPVLARKLKQMAELQLRPDQILIRDKLGFFLGVVNLWWATGWLLSVCYMAATGSRRI